MNHVTVSAVFLVLLALAAAPGAMGGAERQVEVDWSEGTLGVVAVNAPLADVLTAVARVTGLDVEGLAALPADVTVSARFSRLPLAEGLRRLLAGVDHLILEQLTDGVIRPERISLFVGAAAGETRASALHPEPPVARAGDPVIDLLADPDGGMRRWAVEQLAQRQDAEALPRLLQSLVDRDPRVRQAAIAALGGHGQAGLDAVQKLLRDETDPEVRVAAAHFLGQVGRERASGVLRRMLQDHDARARVAAIEALGHTGASEAAEALAEATRDPEPAVRMTALRTLALYVPDGLTREIVLRGLADTAEAVREVAAAVSGTPRLTGTPEGR